MFKLIKALDKWAPKIKAFVEAARPVVEAIKAGCDKYNADKKTKPKITSEA